MWGGWSKGSRGRGLRHAIGSERQAIGSLPQAIGSLPHAIGSLLHAIGSLLHAIGSLLHAIRSLRHAIGSLLHACRRFGCACRRLRRLCRWLRCAFPSLWLAFRSHEARRCCLPGGRLALRRAHRSSGRARRIHLAHRRGGERARPCRGVRARLRRRPLVRARARGSGDRGRDRHRAARRPHVHPGRRPELRRGRRRRSPPLAHGGRRAPLHRRLSRVGERTAHMRTIGLLGGMSWESTLLYYRLVNEEVRALLGGLASAKLLLYSVDFAPIARMQAEDRWDEAGAVLADAAAALERGGADFVVLCTNTMHKVAGAIEARVRIPLLHIVDPTATAIQARGLRRVGLLATRFTMEQPFYADRMRERFGLDVLVPPKEDRDLVHRVIYDELCVGRVLEESREEYRRIAEGLVEAGAEGIIFGCTEIGMLLSRSEERR